MSQVQILAIPGSLRAARTARRCVIPQGRLVPSAWTIRERKENEIKLCWSGTKRTVARYADWLEVFASR